jgi:hypothetical protein
MESQGKCTIRKKEDEKMALPISLPVIISAITALVRFRDRIDTILALNEATAGLPFALPPPPKNNAPFLKAMLQYFNTDQGKMALHLHGLESDFNMVAADPYSTSAAIDGPRNELFELFYEASDTAATYLGPDNLPFVRGPGPEMRLAYFVVESQRLSKNTVLARVLLTVADTLLEFTGENASYFIANPATRTLVEDLIEEFAGKRDFDDEGIDVVFKSLLGSTVLAFAKNPPDMDGRPALKALFAALGTVRDSLGNDFAARIISVEGFEGLISSFAAESAKDPSFNSDSALLQKPLAAMLSRIGTDFPKMVDDPKAFLGVLEAGLGAAVDDVSGLIAREFGNQPALAAVLSSLMGCIGQEAQKNQLFAGIATGSLVAGLYKTALAALASAPLKFTGKDDADTLIAGLVAGVAQTLFQKEISQTFSPDTLRTLASQGLAVLASHPEIFAGNDKFATALFGAVLASGAQAIGKGATKDDLMEIVAAAIKTASENAAFLGLDEKLCAVISSIGKTIDATHLLSLNSAKGQKDLLLTCIQAVAANPAVWGRWEEKKLVQPVLAAVVEGLKNDPTTLLTGPVLVDAVRRILLVAARQGNTLLNESATPEALKMLLATALEQAGDQIGKTIDGENLPVYLERVVVKFLVAPFDAAGSSRVACESIILTVLGELSRG